MKIKIEKIAFQIFLNPVDSSNESKDLGRPIRHHSRMRDSRRALVSEPVDFEALPPNPHLNLGASFKANVINPPLNVLMS